MNDKYFSGKITFIHHEKNRAVIEYTDNGRKKTIQAAIDDSTQNKLIEQKIIKKLHRFLAGDTVKFKIKKTGSNGKILYADNVQYQFNTALEILVNKTALENKFTGYIKITDDKYFIKEIESYLFFPLIISAFEIPPTEKDIENPVIFKLENLDKPGKIAARLYNHNYIPEFQTAVQHFKKELVINATIYNITAFGIYLNLFNDKIKVKLSMDDSLRQRVESNALQINSVVPVKIKHISASRIIVKEVNS